MLCVHRCAHLARALEVGCHHERRRRSILICLVAQLHLPTRGASACATAATEACVDSQED